MHGDADFRFRQREDLRRGSDRRITALVHLTQNLDHLPYIWSERQCGPAPTRSVLEGHPRVIGHTQTLVDQPLG